MFIPSKVRINDKYTEEAKLCHEVSAFFVQGDVLGETTVTATAKFGDRSTSSQPMPIQVFPPLQLEPRNITLIIGAKFQVRVVGGPQPSSALEFALANGEYKVTEDTAGLVEE